MLEMKFYAIWMDKFVKKLNKTWELKNKSQKVKEVLASKLKKIAKNQVFGKPINLLCPHVTAKKSMP